LAVELATNPSLCARLKQQLAVVKEGGVLFDSPRFVRQLEDRLLTLSN
jgi:predicted O-linked N-acetylglucosamine transferase (SPINDLY family)